MSARWLTVGAVSGVDRRRYQVVLWAQDKHRRPDDTGVRAELGPNKPRDPAVLACEDMPVVLSTERVHEQCARFGQTAANDDHVDIDEVDQ